MKTRLEHRKAHSSAAVDGPICRSDSLFRSHELGELLGEALRVGIEDVFEVVGSMGVVPGSVGEELGVALTFVIAI